MAQNSKIAWTDHTANLWWGCVEVSPSCDNCYAREWSKRYDRAKWGANEPRLAINSVWNDLAKFQRDAAAVGRVHRVFVGSMMDIFEKSQPVVNSKGEPMSVTTGDLRQRFFRDVVPASPNLLFLMLTKRPSNIVRYIPAEWEESPPDNVMFGTSVGTYETALDAIPRLAAVKGRLFLSIEPLMEDLALKACAMLRGIEWYIVGAESGGKRRPMDPAWARSIRELCAAGGMGFFMKQMDVGGRITDEIERFPEDLRVRDIPSTKAEV